MTPKTTGWDELNLAEDPAVDLLQSLGYTYVPPEDLEPGTRELQGAHPHQPPHPSPQAAQPLALRAQPHQGRQGGHPPPGRQSRRGQPDPLHLPHLRHRLGAGPRRGTQEPHGPVPRLRRRRTATSGSSPRSTGSSGRRSTSSRTSSPSSTACPSRSSSARARPSATPGRPKRSSSSTRYQEADSRWKDQGAPRLFEAAQILVGTCGERAVYGTVGTSERFFLEWKEPYPLGVEQLGEQPRARADAAGHPALRAPRAAQPPRHCPQLRRLRGRGRPRRPQADPLQTVHRRQRGDAGGSGRRRNRARGAASSGTRRGRARA